MIWFNFTAPFRLVPVHSYVRGSYRVRCDGPRGSDGSYRPAQRDHQCATDWRTQGDAMMSPLNAKIRAMAADEERVWGDGEEVR